MYDEYDIPTVEIKRISPVITFTPTKRNERQDINSQIYARYMEDKILRKKANWTRYISFLKEHKTPDSKAMQIKFKRTKGFIKELTDASLAYKLHHIKTKDLYYILSAGRDQKNFSAWLLASIKKI